MNDKDVPAMDCWHYIAPLIPISTDVPESISIYVNTFRAFKLLEEEQKEKEINTEENLIWLTQIEKNVKIKKN